MSTDFHSIARDAADVIRQRIGVCEIGVRPLHTADRTWFIVFGQQPLHEPYASMVNAIAAQVKADLHVPADFRSPRKPGLARRGGRRRNSIDHSVH